MTRLDLVVIHLCACEAYGLKPGSAFPVGTWIVTSDGTEVSVTESGALMPRPLPLPWTRPSWAALPHLVLR